MKNKIYLLLRLFTLCLLANLPGAVFAQSGNEFIQVSKRNPRYLEYANGKPYIPIGLNLIGLGNVSTEAGMAQMQEWIEQLSENNGNFIRLWLSNSFWDIEHTASGKYDEIKAQERLDKILALAKQHNIRVKMTLEHFRHFDTIPQWSAKPLHHVSNGGTAASIEDFFSGEASRDLFRKKLDWYAARYGSDPIIFAWELWNEVNTVKGGGLALNEVQEQYDWTVTMLGELHKRFPQNMATQSLGSFDHDKVRETYRAFSIIPSNDLAQVHRYLDLGANLTVCHGPVVVLAADAVKELQAFSPGKPVILAESGAVEPKHTGPFQLYAADQAGIILHDVLFAPFFAGAASPGQIWHWDHYVAKNNLWFHFGRFAEAVKNIDPPAEDFTPKEEIQNRLRVYTLQGRNTTLLWCRDTTNTWITELQQGKAPEILQDISLRTESFLTKNKHVTIQIYDPWRNQWRKAKLNKGTIKLPPFSRSIVIRIQNKG